MPIWIGLQRGPGSSAGSLDFNRPPDAQSLQAAGECYRWFPKGHVQRNGGGVSPGFHQLVVE
jgi:hypothetical protein